MFISLIPLTAIHPAYPQSAEMISVQDIKAQTIDGRYLSVLSVGKAVTIQLSVINNLNVAQPFLVIVEIRNSAGITESLQFRAGTLKPESSTEMGFFWDSPYKGSFSARAFVISSFSRPELLSSVLASNLTVGSKEVLLERPTLNTDALWSKLLEAGDKLIGANEALFLGSYSDANRKAFDAKSMLAEAKDELRDKQQFVEPDEVELLLVTVQYYDDLATLLISSSQMLQEGTEIESDIQRAVTGNEIISELPRIELFIRSLDELGDEWIDYAEKMESITNKHPELSVSQEYLNGLSDIGSIFHESADEWDLYAMDLEGLYAAEVYVPVEDREIPATEESISSDLITDQMSTFFEGFDTKHDGEVDIGEGQDFFYWVESNIEYRYDDENELEPIAGSIVGDGRDGADYRQTPMETLQEALGDCEDMATLEVAFYNYFGVEAYVVGVNAKSPSVLDHAATVVRIADDVNSFQETLGEIVYYEFDEGTTDIYGYKITPGVYMLVDNAYSDAYGYLSNGLEPDTFSVQCIIPLDFGYDYGWYEVTSACSIPMD